MAGSVVGIGVFIGKRVAGNERSLDKLGMTKGDDGVGVGRDNRSAGGVWMTGYQPDGALMRCPGPPAAA